MKLHKNIQYKNIVCFLNWFVENILSKSFIKRYRENINCLFYKCFFCFLIAHTLFFFTKFLKAFYNFKTFCKIHTCYTLSNLIFNFPVLMFKEIKAKWKLYDAAKIHFFKNNNANADTIKCFVFFILITWPFLLFSKKTEGVCV